MVLDWRAVQESVLDLFLSGCRGHFERGDWRGGRDGKRGKGSDEKS